MQSFVALAAAMKVARPMANVSTSARRHLCSKSDHQRLIVCEQLASSRKLVRLRGSESLSFLQGLVTNDTRHLSATEGAAGGKPRRCMYALMLNSVGRVLYDLIVYRPGTGEDEVLVECDADARQGLLRLLRLYLLRKPIEIGPCDDLDVWAVFHPFCGAVDEPPPPPSSDNWPDTTKGRCVVRDPRLNLLGSRVLADAGEDLTSADPTLVRAAEGKEPSYAHLRMQLGVGEGLRELPPAACFPLECNADYLGGVSFHKGCYVGQELTARTHHTGVVRKRLMPVVMLHEPSVPLPPDAVVRDAAGATLGKLRAHRGPLGLALLRVHEALAADTLHVEGVPLSVAKPGWWPRQAGRCTGDGQATT